MDSTLYTVHEDGRKNTTILLSTAARAHYPREMLMEMLHFYAPRIR